MQGGVTKLKEYMRGLNILPHKRKRKLPPGGIPRSPCTKLRSPRSPDGTLPGHSRNSCLHPHITILYKDLTLT